MILIMHNDPSKEFPYRLAAMKDDGSEIYSVISQDADGAIRMMARHIDRTEEEIRKMLGR
jgi:DNA-binding GntR family transcriptional regulator